MYVSGGQFLIPANLKHHIQATRIHVMHRQYQEICRAQQEASARNKLLLEDVNRLQRRLSTPARSKLQQLKVTSP